MFLMISLIRTIVVWQTLAILTAQGQRCEQDEEDFMQNVERYSGNLSTIMLHHELSWPAAETESIVLYTVQFRISKRDCWYALDNCQNIIQRICDVDKSSTEYFLNPLDFEFRITGRLAGSNQTIYVTEPIFFNRHKNLTLDAPSVFLSDNSSQAVTIYLKLSEEEWKGLNDMHLKTLKYEIQYWNGGESDPIIHNTTASKIASDVTIKTKNSWICGRARLHVNVDDLTLIERNVYSPWSEIHCTPSSEEPHFNVTIPALAIACFVVIALVALSIRNIYGNVCKDFFKKAPLPDAVVKIIFNDDASDKDSTKTRACVTEEFEAIDCENNNQSWTTVDSAAYAISPIQENVELVESPIPCMRINRLHEPLPLLHHSNDLTYGIGCPQDSDHKCFMDDSPASIDVEDRQYSSNADRVFRYRNYLSSTSTTSTELSPVITDERSHEYRLDDLVDGVTIDNMEISHDSQHQSNMYFRRNSFSERIRDFDGFNIAYSSNPLRDVPDLLCLDRILVNE